MRLISNKLAYKVGISVILAEIIVLTIVGFIYINRFNAEIENRLVERLSIPGNQMNAGSLDLDTISNKTTMKGLVGEELIRGFTVGINGNIFYSLDPELLGSNLSEIPDIDPSLFSPQQKEPIVVPSEDRIASLSPIFGADGETVRFFTYIEATTAEAQAQRSEITRLFVLGSLATIVVTSAIILFSFDRILLRRVDNIATVAGEVGSGNLNARAEVKSHDELGQLALAFNSMASQLQQTLVGLEERVAERTKDLEIARQEAEIARNEAEKANNLKTQFLSNMSHELRTPLNAIINLTGFVADGVMGDVNEEQVDALNKTVDSGQHLLSLINDVLDLTKIEAGMMNVIFEDVDLDSVLHGVLSSAKGLMKNKPIELTTEFPEKGLPHILGDKRRIRQILLNLVSNAVKYTIEGEVHISAKVQETNVHIAVQDTGIGIAEEDYDLVFQTFSQARHSLDNVVSTGLGLPITKQLVELHSGEIWFESEVDKGSVFHILLPLSPPISDNIMVLQENKKIVPVLGD